MSFIAGVLRRAGDDQQICAKILARAAKNADLASTAVARKIADGLTFGLLPQASLPEDCYDCQPWSGERWALVGDVRLDNRDDLQRYLGIPPSKFAEMSDSLIFLECWKARGAACLDQLCGGFAVAVWDNQERTLWLVRDHPGERPLYYAETSAELHRGRVFASLPAALRDVPGVDGSLEEESVAQYVALVPFEASRTVFRDIKLLPPGHLLVYRSDQAVCRRYWHPADTPAIRFRTNQEYVEALLERFDLAVAARLRTNGKIGSQLSGGMDSSSVTASAARMLAPTGLTVYTAVPQTAFSDLNPEGRFGNEGPAAARVAAMYPNIEHVLIESSAADLFGTIEKTASLTNTPVFNPMNQMWFNAIFDDARSRGINVLLQGVCGNATVSFGGLIGLSDLLRAGRWPTLFRQIRDLRAKGHTSWRGGAYWAVGSSLPLMLRRLLNPEIGQFNFAFSPVNPEAATRLRLKERAFREFFAADKSSAGFRRKMFDYYDAGYFNAAASLGWNISLRDPMQDRRIFEFCFAIPIEQYLAEGQSRSMVRRAMRDRLPPETLACTARGLQAADWYLTLGERLPQMRAELGRIKKSALAARVLDLDRLQHLIDTWPSTGYERSEVNDSYHLALTRGLAAGNFIRHNE